MNLQTVVTIISIIGGGGLVGLLTGLVRISMDYQRLKSVVEQNERRDEEERKENALKFNELYNSRNTTNEALVRLTTTVEMLVTTMSDKFETVYQKIDEIKQEIK
jgi:uncharacterized protein YeaC (DUF1315 family)